MKVTGSINKVFLRLYQVVGSLVFKDGLWNTEMRVRFHLMWEKIQDEIEQRTKNSVLGGFLCNEGYCIHEEGIYEVLSGC